MVRVIVDSDRIAVDVMWVPCNANESAMLATCDYIVIILLYIHKLVHTYRIYNGMYFLSLRNI